MGEFGSFENLRVGNISRGQVVEGKVVKVGENSVFVDIGFKVEGVIPREELPEVEEGQSVKAVVLRVPRGDLPLLSYREYVKRVKKDELFKRAKNKKPVRVKVLRELDGGFEVELLNFGYKGFLPKEEATKRVKKDDEIDVLIKSLNLKRGKENIVVSYKEFLNWREERLRERLFERIKEGEVIKGRVIKIDKEKGITLLVGKVLRAFLPKDELSWGERKNPYDYTEVGETLRVKVIRKAREGFLIVSLKRLKGDPWESVKEKYPTGKVVEGKVIQLSQGGLLVELEEGVNAFIPQREAMWEEEGEMPYKRGDKAKLVITSLDLENRRILGSIKRVLVSDFLKEYEDKKVRGEVVKFDKSKAIVKIKEGRVFGVVHRSDLTWTYNPRIEEFFELGKEYEFKVLGASENFIKLGVKQLYPNPWEEILKKYKVGDRVKLKVKEKKKIGAILAFPEGVEGFLPFVEVPRSIRFSEGDEVEVEITDINEEERKILLSMKFKEQEVVKKQEEEEESGFKLGDIFKKKWKF